MHIIEEFHRLYNIKVAEIKQKAIIAYGAKFDADDFENYRLDYLTFDYQRLYYADKCIGEFKQYIDDTDIVKGIVFKFEFTPIGWEVE